MVNYKLIGNISTSSIANLGFMQESNVYMKLLNTSITTYNIHTNKELNTIT